MKVHIVCVNDSGAAYMTHHQSITHGESGSNIMGQDKKVDIFGGIFRKHEISLV